MMPEATRSYGMTTRGSSYLPGEEGHYEERRVYKIDLLERNATECDDRLTRYLGHLRVMSGAALEAARTDYRDAARLRQIAATLPRAWAALLESQDSWLDTAQASWD